MKKLIYSISLVLISLFISNSVFAFPNMIRHGYTTCMTCHYNASGGGSLKAYGKFVAGETMGFFASSENAMPWIKEPTEDEKYTISFLGRVVQAQFDTPQLTRSELKKMQADVEFAFDYNSWIGLVTVGPRLDSAAEPDEFKTDFFLRRFYLGKETLDYSFKIGKFFPEYGLNLPNHNVPTRKGLFFNHNHEPWNAQASWFTTTFDITASYLKGFHGSQYEKMDGYASTIAYKYQTMRFGLSRIQYKHEDNPKENVASSAFATLGYDHTGYLLVEYAKKSVINAKSKETKNNVGYLEAGWEFHKGFIPYFFWEYNDNTTTNSKAETVGIGTQFAPWTHFELVGQAGKLFTSNGDGYSIFSMLNVYF